MKVAAWFLNNKKIRVSLVKEYPCFYLVEREGEAGTYRFCVNKPDLVIKEGK